MDPTAILENKFVKENLESILLLAASPAAVDLFDPTTWNNHDWKHFRNIFASQVCIHPTHQQLCESWIQALNLVSLRESVSSGENSALSLFLASFDDSYK